MLQKNNPFDEIVDDYEAWFRKNDKLLASEVEAIRPLIPLSGKGIEIGVGTGIFASALEIKDGVEPSESMASEAIKRGIHVIIGQAEKLPVADSSYQFALMVTADCFMDDVAKAFAEIKRILADQGIFIIAFLDKATPLGNWYEKTKHLHRSYQDANFHSAAEIANYLEDTGFEILEKKQTIYSLDNEYQESKDDVGEGVFAVMKARKMFD